MSYRNRNNKTAAEKLAENTIAESFNAWTPTRGAMAGQTRWYLNLEDAGVLDLERYHSGNISSAHICGERLSNGRAYTASAMKIWLGADGALHVDDDDLDRCQTSVAAIVATIAGMDADEDDISDEVAARALALLAQRMDALEHANARETLAALLHEVMNPAPAEHEETLGDDPAFEQSFNDLWSTTPTVEEPSDAPQTRQEAPQTAADPEPVQPTTLHTTAVHAPVLVPMGIGTVMAARR